MALVPGDRPFSVPAAVLAAVIGAGVLASAAEPAGVPLDRLAADHGLVASRDPMTGVVTLAGVDGEVRLAPGFATVAVNGAPVRLTAPVWIHAGRLHVPADFASRLRGLLTPRALPDGCEPGDDADAAPPPLPEVRPGPGPAAPPSRPGGAPPAALDLGDCSGRRVVLDAGHGGPWMGAVGPTGLREKDLALAVTLLVAGRLRQAGATVICTREDDRALAENWSEDLDRRLAVATRHRPDLFVSVHFNSAPDRGVSGFEIHCPTDGGGPPGRRLRADALAGARIEGRRAAEAVRRALAAGTAAPDRGLRYGKKRVVYHADCPAILVECDFLSHAPTEARYRDPAAVRRVADAVATGIAAHLRERRARP